MVSWHGREPDGCPVGGIRRSLRCGVCGARFVRGPGDELISPEAADTLDRERQEQLRARWAARRVGHAKGVGSQDAEPV